MIDTNLEAEITKRMAKMKHLEETYGNIYFEILGTLSLSGWTIDAAVDECFRILEGGHNE